MTKDDALLTVKTLRMEYICDIQDCFKEGGYDAEHKLCKECDGNREALTLAAEAMEKADKYRWHDLRKNPKDLPNKFEDVLIAFKNNPIVDVAMYGNGGIWATTSSTYRTGFVVAWKHIEPFKEQK